LYSLSLHLCMWWPSDVLKIIQNMNPLTFYAFYYINTSIMWCTYSPIRWHCMILIMKLYHLFVLMDSFLNEMLHNLVFEFICVMLVTMRQVNRIFHLLCRCGQVYYSAWRNAIFQLFVMNIFKVCNNSYLAVSVGMFVLYCVAVPFTCIC